jgi:hypothetical protein
MRRNAANGVTRDCVNSVGREFKDVIRQANRAAT